MLGPKSKKVHQILSLLLNDRMCKIQKLVLYLRLNIHGHPRFDGLLKILITKYVFTGNI